jgi:hypothetical protein
LFLLLLLPAAVVVVVVVVVVLVLLLLVLLCVSLSLHWVSLLLVSSLGLHQDLLSAKRMNSRPYHRALGAPVLRWRQPVSQTTQLHDIKSIDTG